MPLTAGARVLLARPSTEGTRLSQLITAEKASFVAAKPSVWQRLLITGLRGARGLRLLSFGAPLPSSVADELLDRAAIVWNGYGTPETTDCSTLGRVERSAAVTVGRPIANVRVYVVDSRDRAVPVGVWGELLVAGAGVATGYADHSPVAASALTADPFGPGTVYRTGSLVRWRPDGQLEVADGA
jgi:non-ribosomal peptide synthetase component F